MSGGNKENNGGGSPDGNCSDGSSDGAAPVTVSRKRRIQNDGAGYYPSQPDDGFS